MEKFTLCKLFGYLCNQCEFVSECDHGEIYMGFLYTMLLIINSRKKSALISYIYSWNLS